MGPHSRRDCEKVVWEVYAIGSMGAERVTFIWIQHCTFLICPETNDIGERRQFEMIPLIDLKDNIHFFKAE